MAVDPTGNIFVVDGKANVVRKMTPSRSVSTIAGLPNSVGGLINGSRSSARFNAPSGIAMDKKGVLYVADAGNAAIRTISASGTVSTLSGGSGLYGSIDGALTKARFEYPFGIAVDANGVLYISDPVSHTVRKLSVGATTVSTLAGTVSPGTLDGNASAARFYGVQGIALASGGTMYVTDGNNHTVRKLTASGGVSTLAGYGRSFGAVDGSGTIARFKNPEGVTAVGGTIFIADRGNHTIRKIGANGMVSTFAGLAGVNGIADGSGRSARFNEPNGLASDAFGNLYVSDAKNHAIRKISPTAQVTTFAGLGGAIGSQNGTGSGARFNEPGGLVIDGSGNIIVADSKNHAIRRISSSGVVSSIAGLAGTSGVSDGTGIAARFNYPQAVAIDSSGSLYVVDGENHIIRMVFPNGEAATIGGMPGVLGSVDGVGSAARFNFPQGIAIDGNGKIYVTDGDNNVIRAGTLSYRP